MLLTALLVLVTVVALSSLHLSSPSATRLSSLVLASTSALSCHADTPSLSLESGLSLYNGLMHVSPTSNLIDALLGLIGAIALTPWASFTLIREGVTGPMTTFSLMPTNSYYGLIALFSVSGGSLLASSTSLIAVYLSLELQSFGVYVLASLYRDSETATDAGLTYFLLGGLSSCFILLGSAQLYTTLGVTSLDQVYVLLSVGTTPLSTLIGFSLLMLGAGLSFKIAAAPFHQWAPDVYDRVPTIVTTWLQTMPKIAVLGLLLELTGGLVGFDLAKDASVWTETLMLVAVVSLVLGSVLGLAQARIKRLLTYSTISHIGFLLLTLTAYSVDGVTSFLFYLIQYSLTSLATLSVLLAFGYVRDRYPLSDLELISQLTGRIATQPLLSLGLASLLFSMAGIPPFIGFFAKQAVLETSLVAHYGGIAVLAILVSVISASYYLKVVRLMSFTSLDVKTPSLSLTLDTVSQPLAATHTFILSILILIVSLYALLPSTFLDSIRVLALMMALD